MFQILVVEDDRDLNRTVCAFLNNSGCKATGCLSANDAYDAMYEMVFDLIVSDIMMPGIDGFEETGDLLFIHRFHFLLDRLGNNTSVGGVGSDVVIEHGLLQCVMKNTVDVFDGLGRKRLRLPQRLNNRLPCSRCCSERHRLCS